MDQWISFRLGIIMPCNRSFPGLKRNFWSPSMTSPTTSERLATLKDVCSEITGIFVTLTYDYAKVFDIANRNAPNWGQNLNAGSIRRFIADVRMAGIEALK